MKKLFAVMLLALAATSYQYNFPVIRQIGASNGTRVEVRKFEDDTNTCYVASVADHSNAGGPAPSISCVKR